MRLSAFAVALAGAAAGAPDPPPHRSPLKQAASPFGFKVGNAQREQIADKTAAAVRRDTRQNFRISGLFEDLEKEDKRVQKKINADRNLMAFLQVGKSSSFGDSDDDSAGPHTSLDAMDKYISEFSSLNKLDDDASPTAPKLKGLLNPNDYDQTLHHSHNYGGGVITIPLSSQLQTSFLQRKIAPGVEAEVAKQKKWDVYLADDWQAREKADKKAVATIKARREYGE